MTLEEYNELKTINVSDVLIKLKDSIDWDNMLDDYYMVILTGFILWKIKKGKKYKNLNDFIEKEDIKNIFFTLIEDFVEFIDKTDQWGKLQNSANSFTVDELEALILFYNGELQKNDEITPECIMSLADKLLDIKSGEDIVDYNSTWFEFPLFSKFRHNKCNYTSFVGLYTRRDISDARRIIMGLDNINFYVSDVGEDDEYPECNKIFVNAMCDENSWESLGDDDILNEMLSKAWNGYPETFSSPVCFGGALTTTLKKNGRIVLMVLANQLCGRKTKVAREFLVNSGYLKGVIALPEKLFQTQWANVYLIVLERNSKEIRFSDAREIYEKGRLGSKKHNYISEDQIQTIIDEFDCGDKNSRSVSQGEIECNDYTLLPQRYIGGSKYRKKKNLGDCIEKIERGITLSAQEVDEYVVSYSTGIKCVLPSDFSNGIIAENHYLKKHALKKKVNYANSGDLLINKTGKPIRVAVADDWYAVVGPIYILKCIKGNDPYYIKCFLESVAGQEELLKHSVGAKTKVLSIESLNKIEIPVFGEKKTKQIAKESYEITQAYMKAYKDLHRVDDLFE